MRAAQRAPARPQLDDPAGTDSCTHELFAPGTLARSCAAVPSVTIALPAARWLAELRRASSGRTAAKMLRLGRCFAQTLRKRRARQSASGFGMIEREKLPQKLGFGPLVRLEKGQDCAELRRQFFAGSGGFASLVK